MWGKRGSGNEIENHKVKQRWVGKEVERECVGGGAWLEDVFVGSVMETDVLGRWEEKRTRLGLRAVLVCSPSLSVSLCLYFLL